MKIQFFILLLLLPFLAKTQTSNDQKYSGISFQLGTAVGYHNYSNVDDGLYQNRGLQLNPGLEFKSRGKLWWGLGVYYTYDRYYQKGNSAGNSLGATVPVKELSFLEGKISLGLMLYGNSKLELSTYIGYRGGSLLSDNYFSGTSLKTLNAGPVWPTSSPRTFNENSHGFLVGLAADYVITPNFFAGMR